MKLTGYRTVIFALVMGMGGLLGHHLAPETVNAWLDVIFATVAIGGILLRFVTNTPAFQAEVAQLGIPVELKRALDVISANVSFDRPELLAVVGQLNSAIAKLDGHPLSDPATMAALTEALIKLASPPTASLTYEFVTTGTGGGGGGGKGGGGGMGGGLFSGGAPNTGGGKGGSSSDDPAAAAPPAPQPAPQPAPAAVAVAQQ